MFSHVTLQQRIPVDHPARQIRALADRTLARLDAGFEMLNSTTDWPSIAPEQVLRTTLLIENRNGLRTQNEVRKLRRNGPKGRENSLRG